MKLRSERKSRRKTRHMVDNLTPERRSWNMSRIRSKDTSPERLVCSILHRMGYRFRLHSRDLPGNPDIILPRYRTAIFVHGCFWHRHKGCKFAYTPKTRVSFWLQKFQNNVARDKAVKRKFEKSGWKLLTIWECMLQNEQDLQTLLTKKMPKF